MEVREPGAPLDTQDVMGHLVMRAERDNRVNRVHQAFPEMSM